MRLLTTPEILRTLQIKLDTVNMFADHDFHEENLGLGKIKEVYQYGGSGKGDEWCVVYYFEDHNVYIRVDGFYSSYEGTDFGNGWESCREVRPKEKLITVYE